MSKTAVKKEKKKWSTGKKVAVILCSVLLVLIAAFWILHQTGVLGAIMEEVGWWYTRTFYPADRYANVIPMLFGRIG